MEYKKRNSIKLTLFIHLFFALVFAIGGSVIVDTMADHIKDGIGLKYIKNISGYYEMFNEYSEKYKDVIPIPETGIGELSKKDAIIIGICDFAQTWGEIFFVSVAVFIALSLFYKKRLKIPLKLLEESAAKIADQELDFSIDYPKKDEMGHLCEAFEKMKNQLYLNNTAMWKMIDEQKQMRSAFSHDLRTPLSVLKGYVEYLIRYFPKGKLSDKKIMETLEDLEEQTNRIESFANTMKDINYLDEVQINKCSISVSVLQKKTDTILKTLSEKHGKTYTISTQFQTDDLYLDMDIYLEIVENIIANAIRFARSYVGIELYGNKTWLSVIVYDDGPGFKQEEISNAIKPYYHGTDPSGQHYGMGLYICNILCEKHNGRLSLNNLSTGGACVSIRFENV